MKVLVYGWYYQGNIGDDLFIDAFHSLFPEIDFIFTDHINIGHLSKVDAVFFGGGSFLYDAPKITDDAFNQIKKMQIFYIGIGIEAKIDQKHLELMSIAKLIATRSESQIERIKLVNTNTHLIPDLVYALRKFVTPFDKKDNKSLLIIPNIAVLPKISDPHWKHAAWSYFKSEFCQFLDWAVDNKYRIGFIPMCTALREDDRWAATEIVSHMANRSNHLLQIEPPANLYEITKIISSYNIVMTQRFHGIVLSEITNTPYISIHHHDKLKSSSNNTGQFTSYYGLTKDLLIQKINDQSKYVNVMPIESNIFENLHNEVMKLLK